MKTVAFHTLGCKVNTYETEAMQQLMEAAGYKCVDFGEKADVYLLGDKYCRQKVKTDASQGEKDERRCHSCSGRLLCGVRKGKN